MTPKRLIPAGNAYRGAWRHEATQQKFNIFYVSGSEAAANRRVDAGPKMAGWYWRTNRMRNTSVRFQSSRAAWRNARETLAAKSSTETKENSYASKT